MVLNGWKRLGIITAAAWALIVVGLATLEYHAGQYETGDGFFTCWEPFRAPTSLSAAPYWNRDCGLFPRTRVVTDLDTLCEDIPRINIPPHRRYLNIPRFSTILVGPAILIGLVIFAVCWIVGGFRSAASRSGHSEPNAASRPLPPAQPGLPSQSHAEAWLHRLLRRWARNAAIGGGLLAAPSTLALLSKGDGVFIALMLAIPGQAIFAVAVGGYLCGLWARYSLKAPFAQSPTSAVNRIMPNWLRGAILVASFVFVASGVFGLRSVALQFEPNTSFRDWGYLTGFFGTWIVGGYIAALCPDGS